MKNYPSLLSSIDREFQESLRAFTSDPLFSSSKTVYTDDDKRRIHLLWGDVVSPLLKLRKIFRSLMWRSFLTFGSKNSFVVKYAVVTTYYGMIYTLQKGFGPHEEFLRQYLDDTFAENYSTLARYMYHVRFYSVLVYPYEYFITLRDEVDPSLSPLFDRLVHEGVSIEKRWSHDLINIWYYVRYRIMIVLTWIAKYGGRIMMRIHLKRREEGSIRGENIRTILDKTHPGDIILTRQNWAATNLNIPGFWKHMAMYIGTGSDIKKKYHFPLVKDLQDDTHYIVEAIGVGVRIIPMSVLIAHNDYLSIIRPRFSSEKKSRAIIKALSLLGREYDYSFNYYSDMNYVCSTLVTKAYLPDSENDEGLHITLTRIGIGITYPPNDIVKKYKIEYNTEKQELEFVGFIDSKEKTGENFLASEEDFRSSGDRPKLSFFLP